MDHSPVETDLRVDIVATVVEVAEVVAILALILITKMANQFTQMAKSKAIQSIHPVRRLDTNKTPTLATSQHTLVHIAVEEVPIEPNRFLWMVIEHTLMLTVLTDYIRLLHLFHRTACMSIPI